ncbi:hypothetical protein SESBI_18886 [Sesbania bispinosa]|nr:hypothetical protein SESBI_18886 [Sesbania bispinosa]
MSCRAKDNSNSGTSGTAGSFKKKGKGKQDFTKAKIKSGGKINQKPSSGSVPSLGTEESFTFI